MPTRRAAVLYNPVAGPGDAAALAEDAAAVLRQAGWQVQVLATRTAGDAQPLARDCAPRIDRLIVAGGDGSIREALCGLAEAGALPRVEVAILPCGNANVVARELGLPLEPRRALPILASGEPRDFDLGYANDELFLAMAGIGWDARTVRHLTRLRATRLGVAWYRRWADSVYFLAGWLALFTWPRQRLTLRVDDEPATTTYCAAIVSNLRCYGKGWTMTPEARPSSGKLHYQARKRAGPLFVLWQLLAAILGRRTPGFVSDHGAGRKVLLTADEPFALQVDGDDRGDTRSLHLRVEPAAAQLLVPPGEP